MKQRTRTRQPVSPPAPKSQLRGWLQRKCDCNGLDKEGSCAKCQSRKGKLQRKAESTGSQPAIAPVVNQVLSHAGQPLSTEARAFAEPRFGQDFSGVRVHHGQLAAEATNSLDAKAFTHRNQIVFAEGQFNPHTAEGRHLLAHELTHVVQQRTMPRSRPLEVDSEDSAREREADQVADQLLRSPHAVKAGRQTAAGAKAPLLARAIHKVGNITLEIDYDDVVFVKHTETQKEIETRFEAWSGEKASTISSSLTSLNTVQKRWTLFALDLMIENNKLAPKLKKKRALKRLIAYAPSAVNQPLGGSHFSKFPEEVLTASGWFDSVLARGLKRPGTSLQSKLDLFLQPSGSGRTTSSSACPDPRPASKQLQVSTFQADMPKELKAYLKRVILPTGTKTQSLSDLQPIADTILRFAMQLFAPFAGRGRGNPIPRNWLFSSNLKDTKSTGPTPQMRLDYLRSRIRLVGRTGLFARVNFDERCKADQTELFNLGVKLANDSAIQAIIDPILSRKSYTVRGVNPTVVVDTQFDPAKTNECTARWNLIETMCHELMHAMAPKRTRKAAEKNLLIMEGFPEALGDQLYRDLRKHAVKNPKLKKVLEAGISATCPKVPPTPTTGYQPEGSDAEVIRHLVGDKRFQAAYFLGKFHLIGLKPKLVTGTEDHAEEREADRLADGIATQESSTGAPVPHGLAASTGQYGNTGTNAALQKAVGHLSGGEPLNVDVRAFMEPRFGRDLSNVRIHRGGTAQQATAQMGARAFTYGNHISFASGAYQPHRDEGKHLLAHELVHVLQQRQASLQKMPRTPVMEPETGHSEQQAEQLAPQVLANPKGIAGRSAPASTGSTPRLARAIMRVGNVQIQIQYDNISHVPATDWVTTIESLITTFTGRPAAAFSARITALQPAARRWLLFGLDLMQDNRALATGLNHIAAVGALLNHAPSASHQPLTSQGHRFEEEVLSTSGFYDRALSRNLRPPTGRDRRLLNFAVNFGASRGSSGSQCPNPRPPGSTLDTARLGANLPRLLTVRLQREDPGTGLASQSLSTLQTIADSVQAEAVRFFAPYAGRGQGTALSRGWQYSQNLIATNSAAATPSREVRIQFMINRAKIVGRRGLFSQVHFDPRCIADQNELRQLITGLEPANRTLVNRILSANSATSRSGGQIQVRINPLFNARTRSECQARWLSVNSLCHELLHVMVHPNFQSHIAGRQVLREGFTEILGDQLYEHIRTTASFKAVVEAGLSSAPCPANQIPAATTGYGRAGQMAARIRSIAGDQRFRAAYFLGRVELAGIQPKLASGSQNSNLEREADRLANWVLGRNEANPGQLMSSLPGSAINSTSRFAASTRSEPLAEPGSGRPLPQETRTSMELGTGYDLSAVKIHTGPGAAQSASAMGALAYTAGSHIHFAHGQFQPQSRAGKHLLGHELAHVIQQTQPAKLSGPANQQFPTMPKAPNGAVQRQSGPGDSQFGTVFLRLNSKGRVEILYGPPKLPGIGKIGAGFRCEKGKCTFVGGADPSKLKNKTYTIEEAKKLLLGGKGSVNPTFPNLCPPGQQTLLGTCCPPGKIASGLNCVPLTLPNIRVPGTGTGQLPLPGTNKQGLFPSPAGRQQSGRIGPGALSRPPFPGLTGFPKIPSTLRLAPSTARFLGRAVLDGFATNKATLTKKHVQQIAEFAKLVAGQSQYYPAGMVMVTGNTDAIGEPDDNQKLGQRRADSVAEALKKAGLNPKDIVTDSAGESRLVANTKKAHPKNRRVVIQYQPEPALKLKPLLKLNKPSILKN